MSLRDMVPDLPYKRQIIAFYSYKGGVGRTMALCNTAAFLSSANAKRENVRILCIDLDLEAPGVPSFLPPVSEQGSQVRGFLGLVTDFLEGPKSKKKAPDPAALKKALDPQNSDYIYPVHGTNNLFVMPVGSLSSEERDRALDILNGNLALVRGEQDARKAAELLPFFNQLRQTLCETYNYALIDSRTGLADTAFATTALLAQAMVFLFRPNYTQLIGIQNVLARFLATRGLKATDPDLPVIPVLSPRPAYSDNRLQEIRDIAQTEIFKSLTRQHGGIKRRDAGYAPPEARLIELPFDSAFEVGEHLLMPLDPEQPVADSEAPLFKAYMSLIRAIRKQNAAHDMDGAEDLEQEHYFQGRYLEAFDYLLARIALQPGEMKWWRVIIYNYLDHIQKNSAARQRFIEFCHEAKKSRESIARIYSNLFLVEMHLESPLFCMTFAQATWEAATECDSFRVFADVSTMLSRLMERQKEKPQEESGLPALAALTEARALAHMVFQEAPANVAISLKGILACQERTHDVEVLGDLLALTAVQKRLPLLQKLAVGLIETFQLEKAVSVLATILTCSDANQNSFFFAFQRISRFVSPKKSRAFIRTLPENSHKKYELRLALTDQEGLEKTEPLLDYLEKHDLDVQVPFFRSGTLVDNNRYSDAEEVLSQGLSKGQLPMDAIDYVFHQLTRWLAKGEPASEEARSHAIDKLEKNPRRYPLGTTNLLLALAMCPDKVAAIATQHLEAGQLSPLHRFGWAVLTGISSENLKPEVQTTIHANPLLALYTRRDSRFNKLRPVWEKLREYNTINQEQYSRFSGVLELIEQRQVDYCDTDEVMEMEEPITNKEDPRFEKLKQKWIEKLSPVMEDPDVGPFLKRVLANPENMPTTDI